MKEDEVPQQEAKAFMGHSKMLYAENDRGRYVKTASNGWEAEEIVLNQALAEFEQLAAAAWERARRGVTAPLEYHMYHARMDVLLLAQSAGLFKWQVRRHLRPGAFRKLSRTRRERYAEAFGKPADELDRLPERP